MKAEIVTENGQKILNVKLPIIKQNSKSGKTILVATSGGNQITNVEVDGKLVTIGLNAYISK